MISTDRPEMESWPYEFLLQEEQEGTHVSVHSAGGFLLSTYSAPLYPQRWTKSHMVSALMRLHPSQGLRREKIKYDNFS